MSLAPKDFVQLIRPHQWTKNLLVIAPPFFGGVVFSSAEMMINMTMAFFAFSFASSVGYVINDLSDIKSDRAHPKKKNRPIASGRVSKLQAYVVIVFLLSITMALSINLGMQFVLLILLYMMLSTLYSRYTQHVPILDAFSIAIGFTLRIAGGGSAGGVEVSSWLYLTTFLLSLLLAFGKRRFEMLAMENSDQARKVLADYTTEFLDTAIAIFSTISIVTYSLYAVDRGPKAFILTVPFACYGVLRYLYLVNRRISGDPTEALLTDKRLFLCVLLWLILTASIIHFPNFFRFIL